MGLVVESVPVHVGAPTSAVPTPHIPSRVCTDGSSSSMNEDTQSFDRTLYRVFSMRDDMKVLTFDGIPRNEFELFLRDAESKTALLPYSAAFNQLDLYLGSLGVTNEIC